MNGYARLRKMMELSDQLEYERRMRHFAMIWFYESDPFEEPDPAIRFKKIMEWVRNGDPAKRDFFINFIKNKSAKGHQKK
ncbi:MAG: hypothetical protein PHE84_00650 [bacterium]|nr:hypothetical protein [bacterium]